MKRFIIRTGVFLILILIVDQVAGYGLQFVSDHIKIGGTGRDNYICNEAADEVLIFGSSRAESHYNAQLLSDSLGVSCYNCGESGCGILLNYGRLLMLLERNKPNLVIYDIMPDFDYLKREDNHKYLYRLKPHYDREGVSDIFENVDKTEKYKMISGMYRFNSSFFQNILVYLTGKATDTGIKGFRPMKGELDPMKINSRGLDYTNVSCDTLKLLYLERFINKLEGTKLIFIVSPLWYGQDSSVLDPVKEICSRKGILFIDYSNDKKYVHNDRLFKNGQHLNSYGADIFSREIVQIINNNMKTVK